MLKLLLVVVVAHVGATFVEQSIGAKGYVNCRGVRQAGIFVQLYDEDTISIFDSDDLMGSTNADAFGTFCVKGTTSEMTTIEPYILIEHNCGYEGTGQKTNFFYYLNAEYVVEGNFSSLIENLGEIELLTADAPVQVYERKHHHHKHVHRTHQQKINECIPLYVTYKDFFEKAVFGEGYPRAKPLPVDEKDTIISTQISQTVEHESERIEHERTEIRKETLDVERKLEQVEEERLRIEQQRLEEERLAEESRRRIEDEKRREEERFHEEQRRIEEEKAREVERIRQEEQSKQEYEARIREWYRQKEEREARIREEQSKLLSKLKNNSQIHSDKDYDPCAHRLRREAIISPSDPCYRPFLVKG